MKIEVTSDGKFTASDGKYYIRRPGSRSLAVEIEPKNSSIAFANCYYDCIVGVPSNHDTAAAAKQEHNKIERLIRIECGKHNRRVAKLKREAALASYDGPLYALLENGTYEKLA